ncbi:hypothetical protein TanjilG_08727 [Lupinus angustifolius]|uniref:Uncharacterized protein n=1 Tax=Lupinus angustifolius TaxID=3871 RepID=A0A4P1QX57_LUPAN|nr:hypothetical protein TanjilG_08727 [Lupinus angustifolius]
MVYQILQFVNKSYAVSEAGIIILPRSHDAVDERTVEDVDMLETDLVTLKWPRKPGLSDVDLFDSEDSLCDPPPEVVAFCNYVECPLLMDNLIFFGIYIYGRDERFDEEYLSVNGREYPCKVVLTNGRSSEIEQTLSSCLARALPSVAELRLPIPISTLDQGMVCLLDTMSFVDPLPAFRRRQWQVVVLLDIDALSVFRIPSLISFMTDRRALFHKEEYEILKNLIVSFRQAPHFCSKPSVKTWNFP